MPGLKLTLRTLLAYIDDTLDPESTRDLGRKVAASKEAQKLAERIKQVTRRRGITAPTMADPDDEVSDPNTVAAYLSDTLDKAHLQELEQTCLESDVHLAEVAACHQILTLVLTEPVRVPPSANQRMYKLVEPPASDPHRRPGSTLPISGVAPPAPEPAEADDPDAALLLGMRRYSTADSPAGRLVIAGIAAGIAAVLCLAVWMALPAGPTDPPETSARPAYALAPVPPAGGAPVTPAKPGPAAVAPVGGPAVAPAPKPADPKTDDPGEVKKKPDPDPKPDPGPNLGNPVRNPLDGNGVVGRLDAPRPDDLKLSAVITRAAGPAARWVRVDPAEPVIRAGERVVALPGYKAEVKLDSGAVVHLWGNVLEQVPVEAGACRVRFHPPDPAAGFDADLTLDAGRVYLAAGKPGGARFRVRIASETWDVALPNDKSEVLVEAAVAYAYGTRYPDDNTGGEPPQTRARAAVTRGSASLLIPGRFKKFENLPAWTQVTWESKKNALTDPRPIPEGDPLTARLTLGEGDKAVQRALSDTAQRFTDREGVRVLLSSRMTAPELPFGGDPIQAQANRLSVKFAIYSAAELIDGQDDTARTLVAELVDRLTETARFYARQAAVVAVGAWLPRDPANTKLLFDTLTGNKLLPEADAKLICHLLRGYSVEQGRAATVDELVKMLNRDLITVREAALANLVTHFDPEAARVRDLTGIDVAVRGDEKFEKAWKKFSKDWEERAKAIKEREEAAAGKKP